MRFSLRLNNDLTVPQYVELAQRAESLGFDQFWVSSDLFLRSAGVILTAVALNTNRIQLGSCVLNPYTVNPAEVAMLAATLDEVSDGRFLLGIASGAAEFLGWVGIRHGKPLTAMRESVAAIRRLMSNESAECAGEFLTLGRVSAYMRFPVETPSARSTLARWERECCASPARLATARCRCSSRRSDTTSRGNRSIMRTSDKRE